MIGYLILGWLALGALVLAIHWEMGGREEFSQGMESAGRANQLGPKAFSLVAVLTLLLGVVIWPAFVRELLRR